MANKVYTFIEPYCTKAMYKLELLSIEQRTNTIYKLRLLIEITKYIHPEKDPPPIHHLLGRISENKKSLKGGPARRRSSNLVTDICKT